jgi:small subunit ribosomal protein S20
VPNTASNRKRVRQNETHRARNASHHSMLRTYVKKVVNTLEEKNLEAAKEAYKAAVPIIDRMANKGLIHKNKAARTKSRLSAHIKALSAGTEKKA